jgi:hypothetical protein
MASTKEMQARAKLRSQKPKQQKQRKLIGWYWGYNAKNPNDGFEISNAHFANQLDKTTVQHIGQNIFEACKIQNNFLVQGKYSDFDCTSLEQVLDQEQERLDYVVEQMKASDYHKPLNELVELAMIACCAISTLVHFGRLQQDEFNGDSFMWEDSNNPMFK